ncbi:MAG: type II secretion system protein M [Burkholderiaceae bacterium]|nr:type II secretion system protein M [Roseateles sp.]MBV8469283.1 type II secretion system protein M [Burkholderiaceae bacterium]
MSFVNHPHAGGPAPANHLSAWLDPLRQRFAALNPREQVLVRTAAWALALLLAWSVLVQPAWHLLRSAPAQLDQLDRQLQSMQLMAQEARELKATPTVNADQALRALEGSVAPLGDAVKLSVHGDQAVLTLTQLSAEQLQALLRDSRSAARTRPVQAKLQHSAAGYSGSLTLALGAGS